MVLPHDGFEIIGGAKSAFAALDIDDGAERSLVGTAAPKIKAR